ncbi:MAG: GNAT family N-acetyltransferase [Acidobacteria bacterium]|nr:GNAT family N-acetyltransferase [Acidobacteriota bacterium]
MNRASEDEKSEGPFQIRPLRRPLEFECCVEMQTTVWGFDYRDTVPARLMIVARQHGGLVLGAFEGDKLVGFLFAIPSLHQERFAQHSHMLAVLPEYRNRGLGRALKLAQYADAVKRRIPVITWTFDPLEAKNAYLNLNRLGAVSNTYYVNLYGERTSSDLHSGLGTDRFLAEWFIGEERTERILWGADPTPQELEDLPKVLSWDEGARFVPGPGRLDACGPRLRVEVPPDTQQLKKLDREGAEQWRVATREVFRHYFDRGYWIRSLAWPLERLPLSDYSLRRAFYVLELDEN